MSDEGDRDVPGPVVTDEVRVAAGPVAARFGATELRDVRLDGSVLFDRLHLAVRDEGWGTLPLAIDDVAMQNAAGRFVATVTGRSPAPVPLAYALEFRVTGTSLVARLRYRVAADCVVNRIGFCLLHPMSAAGTDVRLATSDGWVAERFPDRIRARSPFTELSAMGLRIGGRDVDVEFAGDRFETEDQRNWIDASYKTFSTPLSRPHPRPLRAGTEDEQAVTCRWSEVVAPPARPSAARSSVAGPSVGEPSVGEPSVGEPSAVVSRPPLGLAAGPPDLPVRDADVVLLRRLRPAWLAVTLVLARDWERQWDRAGVEAAALGVPLDVAVVAGDPAEIERWRPAPAPVPVCRLHGYDASSDTTGRPLAEAVLAARERLGWRDALIAGGSRANFAELNGAAERLPLDLFDEVAFAANPQVHAFDDASVLSTPAALAVAVRDATAIAGDRPVAVTLTLAPVHDADATGPHRLDRRPADPRQHAPLAARWAAAAIAAAGAAGRITIYETAGPWGVLDSDGRPSPAYETLVARR